MAAATKSEIWKICGTIIGALLVVFGWLKWDISDLRSDVGGLRTGQAAITDRISNVEGQLKIIVPLVQNIDKRTAAAVPESGQKIRIVGGSDEYQKFILKALRDQVQAGTQREFVWVPASSFDAIFKAVRAKEVDLPPKN